MFWRRYAKTKAEPCLRSFFSRFMKRKLLNASHNSSGGASVWLFHYYIPYITTASTSFHAGDKCQGYPTRQTFRKVLWKQNTVNGASTQLNRQRSGANVSPRVASAILWKRRRSIKALFTLKYILRSSRKRRSSKVASY